MDREAELTARRVSSASGTHNSSIRCPENKKALAHAPMVGDTAHQRRDHDRGEPLPGLTQSYDRALLMATIRPGACTDKMTGWMTPSSQPRITCDSSSKVKIPPSSGVIAISRIDSTVPLSIVRGDRPIASRARQERAEPTRNLGRGEQDADVVPTSPIWLR